MAYSLLLLVLNVGTGTIGPGGLIFQLVFSNIIQSSGWNTLGKGAGKIKLGFILAVIILSGAGNFIGLPFSNVVCTAFPGICSFLNRP